eukprot:131640_1
MPKKKKKKKKTKKTAEPMIGSFVSAEPNLKPSERNAKKGSKKKGNAKNTKAKKVKKKDAPKVKKKKKKATKQTKSAKKPKKTKSKGKAKKKETKKSKTSTKDTKKTSKKKRKQTQPKTDEAKSPKTTSFKQELTKQEDNESEPQTQKFPWANWKIDDDETDEKAHRTRRSSLGSIRELHIARAKKTGGGHRKPKGGGHRKHKSHKKRDKKHKKKKEEKHDIGESIKDVDIYDPESKKRKRRQEKQREKFKVVPKHHVKRSSLPTYQSVRKNNPQLRFLVKKETDRNLATLMDQPEKRAKSKALRNLSRGGFVMHVNHRYRLEDGRLGVCKYKGRTQFGKSSEDWIGLVIQVGVGEHDGTVQGKTYFRCRDGKGLFVRPYDVVEDMGSQNKMLSKQDIKLAESNIKRYKKIHEKGTTTSADVVERDQFGNVLNNHGDNMDNEKFFNPKTLLDKNKGKKAKKKNRYFQI